MTQTMSERACETTSPLCSRATPQPASVDGTAIGFFAQETRQKRIIAHVDMDCFFAACEIRRNPSLRGKPLIIGASRDSRRGVVSTASYEARAFGVHSATPIARAVSLCPRGIFLRTDIEYYCAESKRIMQLLQTLTPAFEQVSVDEANLDVTHLSNEFDSWLEIGRHIRKVIYEQTGYTCSVGISNSRRVSKIACGYKKPHGVTAVYNAKSFLAPMKIEKIPGVGKKTAPMYHALGIKTIADLASKNVFFVMDHLGPWGLEIWKLANGQDYSIIEPYASEKSVSRETTFQYDQFDLESMQHSLNELCDEISEESTAQWKTISIKVRYGDFTTITRSMTMSVPTTNVYTLKAAVQTLAKANIASDKGVRLLGVRISHLSNEKAVQMPLVDFLSA
ncbi:MAG TPA: DNA polymerase IV [Acidobacteriota bacterium]|nr:DNA polymerase IV [Acidobacteriota bacterium]